MSCVCLCAFVCARWGEKEFLHIPSQVLGGVRNNAHCLQMLHEIGQAQSKPCGINLARANTLGGLLIIEKASAPINVAL